VYEKAKQHDSAKSSTAFDSKDIQVDGMPYKDVKRIIFLKRSMNSKKEQENS
jgi:hypothetical protein